MDNKLNIIKKYLEQNYNYICTMENNMVNDLKNELEIDAIDFVGLIKRNFYENEFNISKDEIKILGIDKKKFGSKVYFVPYSYIEIDKISDNKYQVQCKGFVANKILKEINDLIDLS